VLKFTLNTPNVPHSILDELPGKKLMLSKYEKVKASTNIS
jgi:hypothetical protein